LPARDGLYDVRRAHVLGFCAKHGIIES